MLSIVSHDVRNPLGVVLTGSALLLRGSLPPDKGDRARRQVEAIQRAGHRINALIRDLLDFASIEGGELSLTRRPTTSAASCPRRWMPCARRRRPSHRSWRAARRPRR